MKFYINQIAERNPAPTDRPGYEEGRAYVAVEAFGYVTDEQMATFKAITEDKDRAIDLHPSSTGMRHLLAEGEVEATRSHLLAVLRPGIPYDALLTHYENMIRIEVAQGYEEIFASRLATATKPLQERIAVLETQAARNSYSDLEFELDDLQTENARLEGENEKLREELDACSDHKRLLDINASLHEEEEKLKVSLSNARQDLYEEQMASALVTQQNRELDVAKGNLEETNRKLAEELQNVRVDLMAAEAQRTALRLLVAECASSLEAHVERCRDALK
jgi:hypothetical protein